MASASLNADEGDGADDGDGEFDGNDDYDDKVEHCGTQWWCWR